MNLAARYRESQFFLICPIIRCSSGYIDPRTKFWVVYVRPKPRIKDQKQAKYIILARPLRQFENPSKSCPKRVASKPF